jgi:hypothetical protein
MLRRLVRMAVVSYRNLKHKVVKFTKLDVTGIVTK